MNSGPAGPLARREAVHPRRARLQTRLPSHRSSASRAGKIYTAAREASATVDHSADTAPLDAARLQALRDVQPIALPTPGSSR
jgi:hypothetical protein